MDWSALEPTPLALSSLRVLAVFTVAPVFSHASMAPRLRLGLGLGIALIVQPGGAVAIAAALPGPQIAAVVVEELAIGLALGFATNLIFSGVGLVGHVIALQGGLGAAIAIDPTSSASSGALSGILRAVAVLVFLAIDGHHALIRAVDRSFELLPLGAGALDVTRFVDLFRMGASIFELGAQLAAPITVAMFCANVGVALVARAMPQFNLITVQLPALVGLSFVLVGMLADDLTRWLAAWLGPWPERVLMTLAGAS